MRGDRKYVFNNSKVWALLWSTQLGPRSYCCWVLGLCIALLTAVAGLNYLIDPYAQYTAQLLPPLVQTSRATKLELLSHCSQPPDGLILGSSRVLKLEPQYLEQRTGLTFFNAGVNYGRPEDFLALLRWYRKRWNRLPKMVLLGVDALALAEHPGPDARLLAQRELVELIPEALTWEDRIARWKSLLSWQQTRSSLRSLTAWAGHRAPDRPEEWFQSDGLIVYQRRQAEMACGEYDFRGALEDNKREYRRLASDFDRLSARRCRLMEQILELGYRGGSEMVVFVTPTHPELLEYLDANTDYRDRCRQVAHFLTGETAKYGFRFISLDTIADFGGDPHQFVDGIHPLEPNTRRMVDQLLRRPPMAYPYVVQ